MWPEIETTIKENKRELKLSGAGISERIDNLGLDKALFDLTSINLLNISETSLKILPSEISNLTNLQTLLLFGNELEKLPDTLNLLDKLKVFDVSRNRLSEIPSSLGQLTNLATINCSSNQLTSFPALTVCSKLSTLDLSDNKLMEFPDICRDTLSNLSELNLKGNEIQEIPHNIVLLGASLKHLSLVSNKLMAIPKNLSEMSKLKDLHLEENPIADKRLLKLIQQCRTKQIIDYVKQHGVVTVSKVVEASGASSKDAKLGRKQKKSECRPAHKIIVQRHTDDSIKVIYMDSVKDIRPFVLCCLVKNLNLTSGNFKKFLQIQTKLHETVCGKREKSTIATHDLAKLCQKGNLVRYNARQPGELEIVPLGKMKKVTAQRLYDQLKAEAEALRKEKKRNVYSGIHKYLYLLDKKELFSCVEDGEGNVISLPPLTNGDLTKISPETTDVFIEVTSSSSAQDCRLTIEELLREMLMAGFGIVVATAVEQMQVEHQLIVQQIKITDMDGNLRTVFPSKTDLMFDEAASIYIERE